MAQYQKDVKIKVARELAVKLAPYLWDRRWGFGLNMYFDDVHVDYREMNSYLFADDQACDENSVLEHFDEACIEYGAFDDENYKTYKEILALDPAIEIYISCEQEIYEQIYLNLWDGQPAGKGMVDAITETMQGHNMIWDLEDYSIVVYSDEPE